MTPTSNFIPIHIVLVRPIYSRNVGNVARVMGNMNAQQLILIDPKCEADFEARQGAAGSQTHLIEAIKYASWADFYKTQPDGIRIAFSARRNNTTSSSDFKNRIDQLLASQHFIDTCLYLVFGPEDHGLTNEDLEYINFICTLPVFGQFKSLNLSHAVLLALFIFRNQLANTVTTSLSSEQSSLQLSEFYFPKEIIKDWLCTLGFELGERRTDAYKVLSRILLSNISSAKELRVLESVLQQTVRKLKSSLGLVK